MPPGVGALWEGGALEGEGTLPPGFAEEFADSMPLSYRVLFDPRTVRRHALVSYHRAGRPAHAEVWRAPNDLGTALCVVADDRPGLLSAIAATLVSHRLDVITALVFSRRLDEAAREAVDVFWVRRADSRDGEAIDAGDAVSIGEVLNALLLGRISIEELTPEARATPVPGTSVTVRFDEDGGLALLFVDAPDRPGILLAITRELFRQGAQIVRSFVRTADGRAFNNFGLVEWSGGPLSPERREQIAAAILAVITLQPAGPRRPPG